MEQTIMPHWLSKQAKLAPHHTAIEMTDGTYVTFLQLKQKSTTFAYKLAKIGVTKGSRVAILSTNSLDMVITLHALTYLQAVAVMINTKLTKEEITYQLETADVTLLIQTENLHKEKQLGYKNTYTFTDVHKLEGLQVPLADDISLHLPCTMMFTSGTTGKPKAVIHTYGNHWWSAIGSMLNLGLHKDDKWLLTLPIFHVGGLSILLKSVIYGMEIFLMEKYDPVILYQTLKEKNITIASLVTLMLRDLINNVKEESVPPSLRCILLGGGAVPAPLLQQVKEKQIPLFQSYGMTETSSQIVTLGEEDSIRKIGSSGKPLFPADIKIAEPDENGIGEIIVKGPMVIKGYDKNPKANKKSFEDGWFRSGDLGLIDEEGFLYVVERRTDLIISGGENIYPSEIENVLLEIPTVKEVAVVGKPDETWGQVPVGFIVCTDESLDESSILDVVKTKLASFKIPKEIYFLSDLPKTASNKIMRHQLVKMLDK